MHTRKTTTPSYIHSTASFGSYSWRFRLPFSFSLSLSVVSIPASFVDKHFPVCESTAPPFCGSGLRAHLLWLWIHLNLSMSWCWPLGKMSVPYYSWLRLPLAAACPLPSYLLTPPLDQFLWFPNLFVPLSRLLYLRVPRSHLLRFICVCEQIHPRGLLPEFLGFITGEGRVG